MKKKAILVIGAGAWGTGLACQLCHNHNEVYLLCHSSEFAYTLRQRRVNTRYLPHVILPDSLQVTADLSVLGMSWDGVIIAVPSSAFLECIQQLAQASNKANWQLCWATKGLAPEPFFLLHEAVKQLWPSHPPVACFSGPAFASEVATNLPTAMVVHAEEVSSAVFWQEVLGSHHLRLYCGDDLIGASLCGAVKNVLAIACGMCKGLQLGANAEAALITRGIKEMIEIANALGASTNTVLGLTGLGDLVLTARDEQSRNRTFGRLLAQGLSKFEALARIGHVVEGVNNCQRVLALANQYQLSMPICRNMSAVIEGDLLAEDALNLLMDRPAGKEFHNSLFSVTP